jgi:hypothetical protein
LRHVLLACWLAAAAPGGLFAQGTDNVRTYWVPTTSFYIPFKVDNDPRLVDVLLHVSTDGGRTYTYAARARPNERRFSFQAKQDGWHSFIVQKLETDGALSPSDLRGAPPSIRVCVDTQKPIIRLELAKQPGWPVAIQWEIQDDNFEDVRAYYRSTRGGEWFQVLDLPRQAKGVHGWRPNVAGPVEVQMQARDKAGNVAEPRSVTVEPDPQNAKAAPPGGNDPSEVKYVKGRKFQLDYQLDEESKGPSGVKSVDIWKMHEGGPWQKCQESGKPDGPATVTVDSAGRWGFRLIPRSGVGLAEPDPRPGDPPDLWVEVDERAPQVEINRLLVGQGADAGNLTVYWTASDKFLRARPISILYATDGKDWKEVARDLSNTGSYTFKPLDLDRQLYQFYVKVTAIDEAENVGEAVSKEPVKVDLKVPRIKKQIQVKPSEGEQQSRGPAASPAPPQQMLLPGSQPMPPPAMPTDFSSPGREQRKP